MNPEIEKLNAERERNVNAGISAYSGAGATRLSQAQGLGTISSETLSSNQSPVVIPPTTQSTTAEGISGLAQAQVEQAKVQREQEAKAQEAQQAVSGDRQSLANTFKSIIGLQQSRPELEKQAGLDVKAQRVTDVTNQIEASTRAQTNELRALDGRGLTDIQKSQQVREINRRYAFEQADLALIQSAANRDLDTATRIIDRKIALQLEPLQTQLEFTKMFYQDNKDALSKAEDRAFTTKINQLNQQYETEKQNRTAIANIQLEALKNGVNIPASVMNQLNSAKDAAEATSILARNGISLQDPLDRARKIADINRINAEINSAGGVTNATVARTLGITEAQFAQLPADTKNSATLTAVLGSSKVGQGTKTQIANVLGVINASRDLASSRPEGKFEGANPLQSVAEFFLPNSLLTSAATENQGQLDAINLKVQQWASGASLTAQQIEQVNRFTPKKTDSDSKVRTKLNNLTNFMLTQAQSQLQSEGVQYTPEKVNLFETYDLLKQATPEQKEQLRAAGLIK